MKVQCEYCQNMVEVQPGMDKVCPFCGGPLPAAPEPPPARPQPQAAKPRSLFIVLLLFVLLAAGGILYMNSRPAPQSGDPADRSMPDMRVSDALDALNGGTEDGGAYMVVINYYLEGGQADNAYQACKDLLELPDGGTYMSWCVQELG